LKAFNAAWAVLATIKVGTPLIQLTPGSQSLVSIDFIAEFWWPWRTQAEYSAGISMGFTNDRFFRGIDVHAARSEVPL
jgi:hypothetical protein